MIQQVEVLMTPAEFSLLPQRDLSEAVCVVFDVLRATSSMITALANGATAIRPVVEIEEGLKCRQSDSEILLAGERDGLRIEASLTGSIGFDLGNSPREFTSDKVSGKKIAMTTTNGTRALRSCQHAKHVLVGAFLNLAATAQAVRARQPKHLIVIGSGTFEESALEDVLGAGALCDLLEAEIKDARISDSVLMARELFERTQGNLLAAISGSRNGRRLLSRPELAGDVAFCAQRDVYALAADLGKDGWVRSIQKDPGDGR